MDQRYEQYLEERKKNGQTSGTAIHQRRLNVTDGRMGLNPAFATPPFKERKRRKGRR